MYLSYCFVLLTLPLYVAQITISNGGDEAIQAVTRDDDEIRTVTDDGKANEKRYKCEKHKLAHVNIGPSKYHMCNKTFERFGNLKGHQSTHGNERPFKCYVRNEPFGNLRRHQLTHGNTRLSKCDKLEEHINTYKCRVDFGIIHHMPLPGGHQNAKYMV
ncbi:unnamed protein product [Cercopithifilaria johnstoni]|uniref:C2H2-type domain-containing protein n=1 Tax=Cercopithifilaria johnstoni TaxID=2874296 RepID=A0A8J2Q1G3_9BILA|nr:unnamed protein product [Cercopithifilaria johnstoni]